LNLDLDYGTPLQNFCSVVNDIGRFRQESLSGYAKHSVDATVTDRGKTLANNRLQVVLFESILIKTNTSPLSVHGHNFPQCRQQN